MVHSIFDVARDRVVNMLELLHQTLLQHPGFGRGSFYNDGPPYPRREQPLRAALFCATRLVGNDSTERTLGLAWAVCPS